VVETNAYWDSSFLDGDVPSLFCPVFMLRSWRQDDTAFVVGLVAVAAADPLELFDDPVVALGSGVGHAGKQKRLDARPPGFDGGRQAGGLGHVRCRAGVVEPKQPVCGGVPVPGGQGLPEQFSPAPGRADLIGRVVGGEDPLESDQRLGGQRPLVGVPRGPAPQTRSPTSTRTLP